MQIVFTTLAVVSAVVVACIDKKLGPGKHMMFLGVPLLSWLILAALICTTVRLSEWMVYVLVKSLEGIATFARLENVHYTLMGLSNALKCATSRQLLCCSALRIFKLSIEHEIVLLLKLGTCGRGTVTDACCDGGSQARVGVQDSGICLSFTDVGADHHAGA
jgi:hypothetical protein